MHRPGPRSEDSPCQTLPPGRARPVRGLSCRPNPGEGACSLPGAGETPRLRLKAQAWGGSRGPGCSPQPEDTSPRGRRLPQGSGGAEGALPSPRPGSPETAGPASPSAAGRRPAPTQLRSWDINGGSKDRSAGHRPAPAAPWRQRRSLWTLGGKSMQERWLHGAGARGCRRWDGGTGTVAAKRRSKLKLQDGYEMGKLSPSPGEGTRALHGRTARKPGRPSRCSSCGWAAA